MRTQTARGPEQLAEMDRRSGIPQSRASRSRPCVRRRGCTQSDRREIVAGKAVSHAGLIFFHFPSTRLDFSAPKTHFSPPLLSLRCGCPAPSKRNIIGWPSWGGATSEHGHDGRPIPRFRISNSTGGRRAVARHHAHGGRTDLVRCGPRTLARLSCRPVALHFFSTSRPPR